MFQPGICKKTATCKCMLNESAFAMLRSQPQKCIRRIPLIAADAANGNSRIASRSKGPVKAVVLDSAAAPSRAARPAPGSTRRPPASHARRVHAPRPRPPRPQPAPPFPTPKLGLASGHPSRTRINTGAGSNTSTVSTDSFASYLGEALLIACTHPHQWVWLSISDSRRKLICFVRFIGLRSRFC